MTVKKWIATLAATVALIVTQSMPANCEDLAAQIVGAWQQVSLTQTETATGKVSKPFGDKLSGYNIYTKGGHLVFTLFGDNRQKPGTPVTDADRVKLFSTLAAGSATYKVEGNTLAITYNGTWHELWTGSTQKRKIEISGNKLTISSEPTKDASGTEIVFVNVLQRVE
jgi:hypothetical protein